MFHFTWELAVRVGLRAHYAASAAAATSRSPANHILRGGLFNDQ